MLRCIEHVGGKVSVHYRQSGFEVMVVEVAAGASLSEPSLWGSSSWYLVLDGQAVFRVGEQERELLPGESLELEGGAACAIMNPSPDRLRLLSVVAGGGAVEAEASA
jgi:mannose-6-phosphate isomerase-like protein (cupin superfamily)